jgi:hypothetical protein
MKKASKQIFCVNINSPLHVKVTNIKSCLLTVELHSNGDGDGETTNAIGI